MKQPKQPSNWEVIKISSEENPFCPYTGEEVMSSPRYLGAWYASIGEIHIVGSPECPHPRPTEDDPRAGLRAQLQAYFEGEEEYDESEFVEAVKHFCRRHREHSILIIRSDQGLPCDDEAVYLIDKRDEDDILDHVGSS